MRYRAFISYASADRAIGERFQRAIEHYRIPRPLRGDDYGFGPVPKRLTPLFRDRSDASAGRDLGATLCNALEASDALVVLCSPASARSKWVNEEIRTFKRLGRNAHIFPVIVAGASKRYDPDLSPDGAFPPALYQRFGEHGALLEGEDATPLAPDLRENGDGIVFAKLKVAAALTGVPLTLLTQRQQEAERRERLVVRWVAATMAALALGASVAAVQAWRSAESARVRLGKAIEMAARRVDDAARFQQTHGVPAAVIGELLDGAQHDFDELVDAGDDARTPMLELQRSRMLTLLSAKNASVGDGTRALALARDGLAVVEDVATERRWRQPSTWFVPLPSREQVENERFEARERLARALAASESGRAESVRVLAQGLDLAKRLPSPFHVARFWSLIGEQRYYEGDLPGALAAQDAALHALGQAVPSATVTAGDLQRERLAARAERAEYLFELARTGEAFAEQSALVSELEAIAASAPPGDGEAQRNLALARVRQENMRYAVSNDWSQSIAALEREVDVLDRLHASDTARIDYARELAIALETLGDAHLQRGQPAKAEPLFERASTLKRSIFDRDRQNEEARRDLAVAMERGGVLALEQGRGSEALAALEEGMAIRSGGAGNGADSDVVATRDLAVAWNNIANARASTGGGRDWAGAYARAIALMRPLLEIEDAPLGWMRDMAIFHNHFGNALAADGRRTEATAHWEEALRLTERQLEAGSDDPKLPEDLATLQEALRVRR